MTRTAEAQAPGEERADAKTRIQRAALQALVEEGFGGASARAIARRGGFNQASIYYHYPDLTQMWLASLDAVSLARLEEYRGALADVAGVTELVEVMTRMYREDVESGLITAVQELTAGSSSSRALGEQLVARMDAWVELAADVIRRLLAGSSLASLIPVEDMAYALVALYFGVETLSHLDRDRSRSRQLFDSGARLAPLADAILQGSKGMNG